MTAVPVTEDGAVEELMSFIGVHGALAVHEWLDPASLTEDAYSLLTKRSAALGLSDGNLTMPRRRAWTVVEAGQDWARRTSGRLCWWQLSLPPLAEGSILPVQAMISCAQDCLDRVGTADVTQVDLLVPLGPAPRRLGQVLATSAWFGLAAPTARTGFEITIDVGASGSAADPPVLLDALRGLHTEPFTFESVVESAVPVDIAALADDLWFTPGRRQTTVRGSCPEWSLEAAGWVAALVLEIHRDLSRAAMVGVSVRRAVNPP